MNFIRENYEWLVELVREPEPSTIGKICNVLGCNDEVAENGWIICNRHIILEEQWTRDGSFKHRNWKYKSDLK